MIERPRHPASRSTDPPCGISKPTLTIDEIKERSPTGISGPNKIHREIARRTEFAADSPLEGEGFEPLVPGEKDQSFRPSSPFFLLASP
jgi:hypothetical protein